MYRCKICRVFHTLGLLYVFVTKDTPLHPLVYWVIWVVTTGTIYLLTCVKTLSGLRH